MKKNKKERITLSDAAYYKYYNQGNFISVFTSSFLCLGHTIIIETAVSFLLGCVCFLFVKISYIDQPKEFMSAVCEGMTSYSITTIGFLLVSFTMLMVLNDSKSLFRYFALEDSHYKKPLSRILLGVFIIPIGVFITLFIFSMLTGFMIPVFNTQRFTYSSKNLIFRLFVGFTTFLFVFSILEFLSFFHNIYKFIVITSYDASKTFEIDTINRLKIIDGIISDDGSDEIKKNIEDKLRKLNK
jgi:hypothetical protein